MELTNLKQHQLNLLGQLEAARIDLTFHVERGRPLRQFWISAEDPSGEQILLWSDRTAPGPHGDVNLAEVMTTLMEVFRLTRVPND